MGHKSDKVAANLSDEVAATESDEVAERKATGPERMA
jgi:hypothetical protein